MICLCCAGIWPLSILWDHVSQPRPLRLSLCASGCWLWFWPFLSVSFQPSRSYPSGPCATLLGPDLQRTLSCKTSLHYYLTTLMAHTVPVRPICMLRNENLNMSLWLWLRASCIRLHTDFIINQPCKDDWQDGFGCRSQSTDLQKSWQILREKLTLSFWGAVGYYQDVCILDQLPINLLYVFFMSSMLDK